MHLHRVFFYVIFRNENVRVLTMVSRASDWLRQALKDLEHAKKSITLGDYEWACFAAQQAAEKAVKALYQKLGIEVWGHSISRMLEHLPNNYKPPRELIDKAKELDRHYIPTRYPSFHLEGAETFIRVV